MGRKKKEEKEEEFHVEVVTKARVTDDADPNHPWEYLVKWAGYDSDADSWEPYENLKLCERLLESFWKHVGLDDDDYYVGQIVEAHEPWIQEEKDYFARELAGKKAKEAKKQKHKGFTVSATDAPRKKKTAKDNVKEMKNFVETINTGNNSASDSEGSDHMPLASTSKSRSRPPPSSDSEEDMPLSRALSQRTTSGTSFTLKRKASSSAGRSKDESSAEPPRKQAKIPKKKQSAPVLRVDTSAGSLKGKETEKAQPRSPGDSPTSLFSAPSSPPPQAQGSKFVKPYRQAPKIKLMDAPFTGGSTLDTKLRIARGEQAKQSPVETQNRKTSLQSLPSFKKKVPAPSDGHDTTSPQTAKDPSKDSVLPRISTNQASSSRIIQSPVVDSPMQMDDGQGYHADMTADTSWNAPPENPLQQETDSFLAGIMSTTRLGAPIVDGAESGPSVPPRTVPKAKVAIPSFSRKFQWTGDMFYNTSDDHAELLCRIKISDTFDLVPKGTVRLSYCIKQRDSLRFEKLVDVSALDVLRPPDSPKLDLLRPICNPATELAKLGPETDADAEALKAVVNYMTSRRLVSFTPLEQDGHPIGILVIFPSTDAQLCTRFKVHRELQQTGVFVAVLMPWSIIGKDITDRRLLPDKDRRVRPTAIGPAEHLQVPDLTRALRYSTRYCRGLQLLAFPEWLRDYMSKPGRLCFIWYQPSDLVTAHGKPMPGVETRALKEVLTHSGDAQLVGLQNNPAPRFIFVHVGSIKSLHRLEGFVQLCRKAFIQIFSYGTHESVSPECWGVREIYPLGGVATVTAKTVMENPVAVDAFLTLIEDHPLWEGYISPSIIGLLARQSGPDPFALLESGTFPYSWLLEKIEAGSLSLLPAPPVGRANDEKPILEWVKWQAQIPGLSKRGILELCVRHFMAKHADFAEDRWPTTVLEEMSATSTALRQQPSMMYSYRRFTIIRAKTEAPPVRKDSSDWLHLESFDFKDDFYDENDMQSFKALFAKGSSGT